MTTWINGIPLHDEDVDMEFRRLVQFYAEHMTPDALERERKTLARKAREQAIGGLLLRLEARRLELRVSEDRVDARIAAMEERCGGPDALDEVLATRGMDRVALAESIREGLRVDLLVEKITANTPEPAERDIEQAYRDNIDQYVEAPCAEVEHILIRPGSDAPRDHAVARSRAGSLRSRLCEGADFGDLARTHSDCPSGERSGGHLGRITRGTMVPEFEEAVFTLAPGAFSEVVQTPMGYHVLRVRSRDEGGTAPLDAVREKIRDLLRHAARGALIAEYVAELREKAMIEERA